MAIDNSRGIVAMVLGSITFFANDVLVKLAAEHLPLGEIIFVRGVIGATIVWTAAFATGAHRHLRLAVNGAVLLRIVGEVTSTVTYLAAFINLPVAVASAIFQMTPLASTAAGAVFQGETVGWRRWLAVLVGVVGMMFILKPGTEAISPFAGLMLMSVGCVLLRDIATIRMPPTMPLLLTIGLTALAISVLGLAMRPFEGYFGAHVDWRMPDPRSWVLMAGAAICLMLGYALMVVSVRSAEMSVIAPFRYTSLILAFIVSMTLFHERPDIWTWVGAAIVAASGLYTFHRERVRRQQMSAAAKP